jgi:hypothetical protein
MPTDLEKNLEQLKTERKSLADLFNQNPQRLHLAIRIKSIDDQIAENAQALRSVAPPRAYAESRFKRAKSR